MAQRVDEILRIRLDGAEFWDVREYVREKEKEEGSAWFLAEGQNPMSDGTIWRYVGRAIKAVNESCRESRKRILKTRLAKRRNLYAKAVSQGDMRAALGCLDSEAKLLDLFPAQKNEVTGKDGEPLGLPLQLLVRAVIDAEKDHESHPAETNGRVH